MLPISISLVSLGNLKYPVNTAELESWPSEVLRIRHGSSVGLLPDADGESWEYTDAHLLTVIHADPEADFTLGVLNVPLENNYYFRRLSDRVAVLSLHEMAEIVRESEFTLEQFVLRNAYELAVLAIANGKLIPTNYGTWAHDEIRGCLFDMNANKVDIIFSLHRPILCAACRSRISSVQLPAGLFPALDRELPLIQKSLFVRMTEWVKQHPIVSLVIASVSGIVINLIASVIFEKAKHLFSWLK